MRSSNFEDARIVTHFRLTVLVACIGHTLLLCAVTPVEFDALTFEACNEDGIV